jgi:hypothetical protein
MKKMTKDSAFLQVLRQADESLYELWRELPAGEEFSRLCSFLQSEFIHPAIKKEREKAAEGRNS